MAVFTCSLRGTLGAASLNEIFVHTLGIESAANEQTVATALRDTWLEVWKAPDGSISNLWPQQVIYTEATAARVIDPMVPDIGAAFHVPFTGGAAGTQSGMLPSQNAIAVSLTAGQRPNGKPYKGRFYLPTPATGMIAATDGRLTPAAQVAIADAMAAWMDSLFLLQHWPVIWSRTVEDLVNPVSTVRIGDRVDTIRGRRNALAETYELRSIAGPQ